MKKGEIQLTKWWQKAICVFGIPTLINTIAATFFQTPAATLIALLLTALFIFDVVKRKKGKVIWDLDDWWERTVYYIAWASFLISVVLITSTFLGFAIKP